MPERRPSRRRRRRRRHRRPGDGPRAARRVTRAAGGGRRKEAAIAAHQSGRNSNVVHSGIYYRPGSLKARYAIEGGRALAAYCAERGLPFETTGKVIVATTDDEQRPALAALAERGRGHGLAVRELSARRACGARAARAGGRGAAGPVHRGHRFSGDRCGATGPTSRLPAAGCGWAARSPGSGRPPSEVVDQHRGRRRSCPPDCWSTAPGCSAIASPRSPATSRPRTSCPSAASTTSWSRSAASWCARWCIRCRTRGFPSSAST